MEYGDYVVYGTDDDGNIVPRWRERTSDGWVDIDIFIHLTESEYKIEQEGHHEKDRLPKGKQQKGNTVASGASEGRKDIFPQGTFPGADGTV